jgi:hypothetical protein
MRFGVVQAVRRLILPLFLPTAAAAVIFVWPERPVCVIPSDYRDFLATDAVSRQLIFLLFDQNGNEPPVIERRDVTTGHVVSATPLEWAGVAAEIRKTANRNGETFSAQFQISADRSSLLWSQMSRQDTDDAEHPDQSRCAVFDTTTGRRRGPSFGTPLGQWTALSPDGRWLLASRQASAHQLSMIDTWSGRPLIDLDPPSAGSSLAHACFSPDSRRMLLQWTGSPIVYQFDLDSRLIERKYRLAEDTTNADNDNVWETVAEWRSGELRTHLTYCAAGTTQFFSWSFRERTCRRPFDGGTLSPGEIDPLLNVITNCVGPTRPAPGEGDGWVAQARYTNDPESAFSQYVDKVETWIGCGRLVNWKGRYGGRTVVRIIDRATNAVRFEMEEMSGPLRVVLDGQYVLRPAYTPVPGIEVWRTDGWPRWVWAITGGIGTLVTMTLLARPMRRRLASGRTFMPPALAAPSARAG